MEQIRALVSVALAFFARGWTTWWVARCSSRSSAFRRCCPVKTKHAARDRRAPWRRGMDMREKLAAQRHRARGRRAGRLCRGNPGRHGDVGARDQGNRNQGGV